MGHREHVGSARRLVVTIKRAAAREPFMDALRDQGVAPERVIRLEAW